MVTIVTNNAMINLTDIDSNIDDEKKEKTE